jgi:hypothetical protein
MTAPRVNLRTRYTYQESTGRYRDNQTGRFLSQVQVEQAISGVLSGLSDEARSLATRLRQNTLSLEEWRAAMRDLIKDAHLYQAALARGGWAQLNLNELGRIGAVVRYHYGRLERFARQIANELPLDGAYYNRVQWYVNMARPSYYTVRAGVERGLGHEFEQNILGASEHCGGCLDATALGKVPIGTLPPIGTRTCKGGCQCRIRYS